ncbi:hypothetical protein GCM10023084_67900 [Streptomyces lacrimifluminis]|uniref:Uncharacterized protein n=1 Tax=Streptomyces lacrimifluminis TaxID=1500077 RepID=A0A917L5A2_9ACTN|nr:hypothetical protein [Streptomyces lacrimifluminis]GGJ42733.1 hypothetical protein GCM10012282_44500 [Streptomyces lacrimifluminis]
MVEAEWWDALPESVREQVDDLVLRDRRLTAIGVSMAAVRILGEGAPAPGPGLHDCRRVVVARCHAVADRGVRQPDPPRDVDTLAARVGELPGQLAAVEAIGDGDTDGWCVLLVAVLDRPHGEVELAMVRHGSDIRVFNGRVPPWPETREAVTTGTALAGRFSVPFHFASPDRPDDEAPRWRASR